MSWNQNDSNMIKIEDTHGLKIDNMNGVTTFLSFRYSYRIE